MERQEDFKCKGREKLYTSYALGLARGCASVPSYCETACGGETLGKIPFPKTIPSKSEGVDHCIHSNPFNDPELVWVTNIGQKEEMSGIVLTSNLIYMWIEGMG